MSYKGHNKVCTRPPRWINEIDEILRLNPTEKGYVIVTGKNREEKKSEELVPNIRGSVECETSLASSPNMGSS